MTIEPLQVGNRVRYTGFAEAQFGSITRVHVTRTDDSPDAVETYSYDIQLDAGGHLIEMHDGVERING